jgi:signal transduction histidine kinase
MKTKKPSSTHHHKAAKENGEDLNYARLRGDLLTVASRVSHDLRTPLNYIFTAGEAMKEILIEKEPAAAAMADSLLSSAEEITQLIKRVSFVLRASANPPEITTVSMSEPVFIALERLERHVLAKQATVVKPAAWPEVPGVASWLEIIWWNLVMNALTHGGQKSRIELGWQEQKQSIRFWITDNGPGVPADRRKNLFKSFDSLHETRDFAGLGLAIVHRLVELQGGKCGHESPPNGGSLFYFTLPAGPAGPAES